MAGSEVIVSAAHEVVPKGVQHGGVALGAEFTVGHVRGQRQAQPPPQAELVLSMAHHRVQGRVGGDVHPARALPFALQRQARRIPRGALHHPQLLGSRIHHVLRPPALLPVYMLCRAYGGWTLTPISQGRQGACHTPASQGLTGGHHIGIQGDTPVGGAHKGPSPGRIRGQESKAGRGRGRRQ